MGNSRKERRLRTVSIIVLLVSCIGLILFKSGIFADVPKMFLSTDVALSDVVSIRGAVKEKELKLTDKEMRKINWTVRKLENVFNRVNVQVDMADQFAPVEVDANTALKMVMNLKTGDGYTVQSWQRDVIRCDFVPHLVRYLHRAATEVERYKELPEFKGKFSKVYI